MRRHLVAFALEYHSEHAQVVGGWEEDKTLEGHLGPAFCYLSFAVVASESDTQVPVLQRREEFGFVRRMRLRLFHWSNGWRQVLPSNPRCAFDL